MHINGHQLFTIVAQAEVAALKRDVCTQSVQGIKKVG